MLVYSEGQSLIIVLPDYGSSRKVGQFMSAVGRFLNTNDASSLQEYAGQGVQDEEGIFHPFEVRPNVLYRLSSTGEDSFESVYRIVVAA
jgi:hypothetical protein